MDELAAKPTDHLEREDDLIPKVGEWYWIKEDDSEWLGCAVRVGSNYVKFKAPNGGTEKVHFDKLLEATRRELDPKSVIDSSITKYRKKVASLMDKVREVTARLGLNTKAELEDGQSRALATLSGAPDIGDYKNDLIKAKDEELPNIFEEIKKNNERVAEWMKAELLPLEASVSGMKKCIGEIDDRIFNVSLYAGLTEEVVCVKKGKPAAASEKLRVMQRRLYMDEECVCNYKIGGIDIQNVSKFDKWLGKKENLERVLPFPRCMVAMQVRREEKERTWGGNVFQLLVNIDLGELDKLTFLYIRNGSSLYRMNCDLKFGELIFPSRNEFNLNEPQMVKCFAGEVSGRDDEDDGDTFLPKRAYDTMVAEEAERERKNEEWIKENPFKEWKKANGPKESDFYARCRWESANPYHNELYHDLSFYEWEPFDKSSVFYDPALKVVNDKIKRWNRIALIIQGLFDRSSVLHPHAPVQLWNQAGFDSAVELVYDGTGIEYGEPPDFEAYRRRCNESLGVDSVTIGQKSVWKKVEAERENNRRSRSWRYKSDETHLEEFEPYGDKGPGCLAVIADWKPKSRKAVFRWRAERQRRTWRNDDDWILKKILVPADELFNVSAYQKDDYKQFYRDPRTRAQYLKWAPALLSAEEFLAGNLKAQEHDSRS